MTEAHRVDLVEHPLECVNWSIGAVRRAPRESARQIDVGHSPTTCLVPFGFVFPELCHRCRLRIAGVTGKVHVSRKHHPSDWKPGLTIPDQGVGVGDVPPVRYVMAIYEDPFSDDLARNRGDGSGRRDRQDR